MTNNTRDKRFSEEGFSLIELMVVIVIIGIMGAVAIPGLMKFVPNMRLKDAAQDLYAYMQKARLGAAKTNSDWAISFNKANNSYTLYSGWGSANKPEGSVVLSDYHSGVAIGHGEATSAVSGGFDNDITYAGDTLVFNPLGSGSAGYVYLEHQDNTTSYAVGTLTTGVIKIKRWGGGTWNQ